MIFRVSAADVFSDGPWPLRHRLLAAASVRGGGGGARGREGERRGDTVKDVRSQAAVRGERRREETRTNHREHRQDEKSLR